MGSVGYRDGGRHHLVPALAQAGPRNGRSCRLQRPGHQRGAPMKKIEAIIKPFKLDEVKDALPRSASRA